MTSQRSPDHTLLQSTQLVNAVKNFFLVKVIEKVFPACASSLLPAGRLELIWLSLCQSHLQRNKAT